MATWIYTSTFEGLQRYVEEIMTMTMITRQSIPCKQSADLPKGLQCLGGGPLWLAKEILSMQKDKFNKVWPAWNTVVLHPCREGDVLRSSRSLP